MARNVGSLSARGISGAIKSGLVLALAAATGLSISGQGR